MKTKVLSILLTIILTTACSTGEPYYGLMNKGFLPISGDNAFLGANIFLAHEMEQDENLLAFLRKHGSPSAIELSNGFFKSDTLYLYYGTENSVFIANPFEDEREHRRWVLRGPYRMEWRDSRKVNASAQNIDLGGLFYINGRYERLTREPDETRIVQVIMPPPPPPVIKKIIVKRPIIQKVEPKKEEESAPPEPQFNEFKNLNSDQRALLIAKGYAPRNENGDVIHIVRGDNENLRQISRWYCTSEAALPEIAKNNNLDEKSSLKAGSQVIVPFQLVKRSMAMPKDYK